MSKVASRLESALASRRQGDGGFAASEDGSANTESTALAALALANTEAGAGAAAWLLARQRSDGAWPFTEAVPVASWASAWALLALAETGVGGEPLARGAHWLVEREGARPSLLGRTLARATGARGKVEQDPALRGWPWHADAASWAEPTAAALLALRRAGARVELGAGRERIAEGERLLFDRICVGGGWNYGNRRVLGEALPPYPDTTALVLIALQGSPRQAEVAESFAALDALLAARASSLALALGALAAALHGRDAASHRSALAARIERRGPPEETRALAFALLALDGGAERLRVPS
jgi:hypothetical protein